MTDGGREITALCRKCFICRVEAVESGFQHVGFGGLDKALRTSQSIVETVFAASQLGVPQPDRVLVQPLRRKTNNIQKNIPPCRQVQYVAQKCAGILPNEGRPLPCVARSVPMPGFINPIRDKACFPFCHEP